MKDYESIRVTQKDQFYQRSLYLFISPETSTIMLFFYFFFKIKLKSYNIFN